MNPLRHSLSTAVLLAAVGAAQAGTTLEPPAPAPPPMMESEVGSAVSGSLSLDVNTHFISYGADVWGAGTDWNDALFNPSLDLTWALTENVTWTIGTWWDVNDNSVSSIGKNVQEIDVWTGIGVSFGALDVTLLYQAWMYAEDTEQIVDLIFAYDTMLAPSFTVHGRVDEGASGGDTGVVFVLGADGFAVGDGLALGAVSLSLPVNVAFATDEFHGGEGGFAYASAGIGVSLPLYSGPLGEWDLHAGVTFYYTDDSVIPGNPDESFFTGSIGIGCTF